MGETRSQSLRDKSLVSHRVYFVHLLSHVYIFLTTVLVYSVAGLQRSKEAVGQDADEWDPSRWDRWTPNFGEYLPFSIGPRQCPGRVFGRFQIQYVLVRLLQEFERIEWCGLSGGKDGDLEKMKIKVELNLKCAEPVICRFIPRDAATRAT